MHLAVNSAISTSVALVGASVIAVAPIQAPAPDVRVVEEDVSLAAASMLHAPVNVVESIFSAPANMVAALDRLAAALVISGSWNDSHPNNVWGWDPANPAMFRAAIDVLIPFPAFSEPYGRHLDWWATANLPMYAGCSYKCPDLPGMLNVMFKVPMSDFYDEDGHTFPEVINPIDGVPTDWSGDTVKLDPAEPIKSLWAALTAEPTGIKTTTWYDIVTAVANFAASLQVTGHLPDWVAVREIETFFKHILPAPQDEASFLAPADNAELPAAASAAVAEHDDLVELSTPSTTNTLRSVAAVAPKNEAASGGHDADSLFTAEVARLQAALNRTPVEEAPADAPDDSTSGRLDVVGPETQSVDAPTPGSDQTAGATVAAAEDGADTPPPGGKHRKAARPAKDTAADKDGTDTPSSAGKHRKADDDSAGTAASSRAKADSSSESDGGDSGDHDSQN